MPPQMHIPAKLTTGQELSGTKVGIVAAQPPLATTRAHVEAG
jgi:hypothetical protein